MEPSIGCEELFSLLEDDELVVVDCRSDEAWESLPVHIPGALRMCLVDLYRSYQVLPDDELVVLCGSEPDGADARRACRMLRLRGRQAVCLKGGMKAWVDAGLPTDSHARSSAGPELRQAGG